MRVLLVMVLLRFTLGAQTQVFDFGQRIMDYARLKAQIGLMEAEESRIRAETEALRREAERSAAEARQTQDDAPRAVSDDDLKNGITGGFINGRLWALMPTGTRTGYIFGIMDGLAVGSCLTDPGKPCLNTDEHYPKSMSAAEIRLMVDRLYESPENLLIPVVSSLRIVRLKVRGADPGELEKALAFERRLAEFLRKDAKP